MRLLEDALDTSFLLDTEEEDQDGPLAHYAPAAKVTEGYVMGTPVIALCGKVFVPHRDPEKLPMCPICVEILNAISSIE